MATFSTSPNFQPSDPEVIDPIETVIIDPVIADPEVVIPASVIDPIVETKEANESSFDLTLDAPEVITKVDTIIPPVETKQPQVTSWKDAIKGIDKKEIAKALGFNDFAIEMDEHISRGGAASDYINAKGFDWNKVSDADLVISEMKKEFPNATQTQLERLFNKKYNQTELSEEEDKEDGLLIMSSDARRVREKRIEEQGKFKMPEQIIPEGVKTQQEFELQQQKSIEQAQKQHQEVIQFYENNEATKNLMSSKRVAIDLGGNGSFNFKIDKPELITQALTNAETWGKLTSTPQGEPDVLKQQLIGLFAFNPQKFAMELVNYGKSLGEEKLVSEGQNAKKPVGVLTSMVDAKATYTLGKGGQSKQ